MKGQRRCLKDQAKMLACGLFIHCLHLFPDVSTKHGSTDGGRRQKSEEIQA